MSIYIITLLILFQLKHFIADFLLQNMYMVNGKQGYVNWVLPLFTHTSIHGFFTFLIAFIFTFNFILALVLALFDIIIHFSMDRIKASPYYLDYEITDKKFWWMIGLDQMIHHLTHYSIIFIIGLHLL